MINDSSPQDSFKISARMTVSLNIWHWLDDLQYNEHHTAYYMYAQNISPSSWLITWGASTIDIHQNLFIYFVFAKMLRKRCRERTENEIELKNSYFHPISQPESSDSDHRRASAAASEEEKGK